MCQNTNFKGLGGYLVGPAINIIVLAAFSVKFQGCARGMGLGAKANYAQLCSELH